MFPSKDIPTSNFFYESCPLWRTFN